jgi:hypothetical protein
MKSSSSKRANRRSAADDRGLGGIQEKHLVALKETLDRAPRFEGRAELREAIDDELLRDGDPDPLRVETRALSHLARRIILVDPESVRLRGKITRAVTSAWAVSAR